MEPRKGLAEFTAALSFFPQLVAGPILRARQILPQMHELPVPTWDNDQAWLAAGHDRRPQEDGRGSAGDTVPRRHSIPPSPSAFSRPGRAFSPSPARSTAISPATPTWPSAWRLLLGFKIPLNFNLPYFAVSPVDFWRRWHISLSTWLRDYLYIPLGGSRTGGRFRNVMITMLLGGLWHGAAWTFVVWGAFHGLLISATHALGKVKALSPFNDSPRLGTQLVKWAVTFYLVLIGWVLFRAQSLGDGWAMLADMHGLGTALPGPGPIATKILICDRGDTRSHALHRLARPASSPVRSTTRLDQVDPVLALPDSRPGRLPDHWRTQQ